MPTFDVPIYPKEIMNEFRKAFETAYREAERVAADGPCVFSEIEYADNVKNDKNPVFLEDKEFGAVGWRYPRELREIQRAMPKEKRSQYGTTWRAWTMPPTADELAANPWQKKEDVK